MRLYNILRCVLLEVLCCEVEITLYNRSKKFVFQKCLFN